MKKGKPYSFVNVSKHLGLSLFAVLMIFPIYIVVLTSFKTGNELLRSNIFTLPASWFNLSNYREFILNGNIIRAFGNSTLLVLAAVIGSTLMGSMVAYVLSRFEFRFKKILLLCYVLVSITPAVITEVTRFKLIAGMGLYNTIWAGIVLFLATDLINIFIYLQFFDNIPLSLDESALIDGASYYTVFGRILLPLLQPAHASVIIIKGIFVYRTMYVPYLYMPKKKLAVVSTALMSYAEQNLAEWQIVSAGVVLAIIPVLLLYIFLQKNIISGLTSGSVKG